MAANRFAPKQMTKKQNAHAFRMWLNCCTDRALETADATSIANSYGLDVRDVNSEILRQKLIRSNAQ